MANVLSLLRERGFIDNVTSDEAEEFFNSPRRVYCGFDPTSDSLHLGNMVALMGLAWFQKCGHTPVALIGGATGMVGDPSGKSHERNLLDEETLRKNVEGIRANLHQVLDFDCENAPIVLNNYDWFKEFSFIEFLRSVGKHFRLGPMLAKEAVKSRLKSEEGMSFTEFSYQLLQGYDFYYLNEHYGVSAQIGGSDQWGNITAGTELTRKLTGRTVIGITFPLLTKSDGQKFGKSERGAVWLSGEKLSPYEFYQYLFRAADEDLFRLLKMLTFISSEEIGRLEMEMKREGYRPNSLQERLADEVTRIVHGEEGLRRAKMATAAAAPGSSAKLDAALLESIAADIPSASLQKGDIVGVSLIDLLVKVGLQPSKGAARRLLQSGGVYLNNEKVKYKVEEAALMVKESDLIDSKMLLLATGKKNKMIVKLQ